MHDRRGENLAGRTQIGCCAQRGAVTEAFVKARETLQLAYNAAQPV